MENSRIDPPAKEIMGMIEELCDIAGYGIRSGINVGEKGKAAADYIIEKLHAAGLREAKLEPIKVNSPFPEEYEVTVEAEGKETIISDKCFPLHWTVGTPPEGITGELVYVGCGLESDFELVDIAGKIVLIDEKFMRGWIATAAEATRTAIDRGSCGFQSQPQGGQLAATKREGTPENIIPAPVFVLARQAVIT